MFQLKEIEVNLDQAVEVRTFPVNSIIEDVDISISLVLDFQGKRCYEGVVGNQNLIVRIMHVKKPNDEEVDRVGV